MSLELIEVNEENKSYFIEKSIELIKYHKPYAEKMGIKDTVVETYSSEDALKHFNDSSYKHYVLLNDGAYCGVLQINILDGFFDTCKYLRICKIWSDNSTSGVLRFVLKELKELFPEVNSVILECWYDLPANKVYNHLDFQCYCKDYVLKL